MGDRAFTCDRCGSTYPWAPARRVQVYDGGFGEPPDFAMDHDLYLCEECDNLLRKFFHSELIEAVRDG